MAQFIDRTVSVQINRVRQIDNLDPDIPFFTNRADFFPRVTIDGRSFTKPRIDGKDDVRPDDWLFTNQASQRLVPVNIKLFDHDSTSGDEFVDINPASGRRELNLNVDMVTGRVTDGNTSEEYATSFGQTISLEGSGDSDRGAIEFRIGGGADQNLPENALLVPPKESFPFSQMGDIHFRGNSLAAGDFNNDGKDDLVAGTLNQVATSPSLAVGAGGINVYEGTETGLNTSPDILTQGDLRFGTPENFERFGASVAVGNFDNDEFDDVIVGIPFDKVNGKDAGAIHAIYGSSSGLNPNDDQLIHQDTPGIASSAQNKEAFGNVLAIADFDRDGHDDVAVGAPFDVRPTGTVSGGVHIIHGSPIGLNGSAKASQLFNQSTPGIPGADDNFQGFGEALAVGDFNGDGNVDLAIGVPGDKDNKARVGLVDVIFGTRDGLPDNPTGSVDVLSQALSNIPDQTGDEFGKALAVGDFNGDGVDDIAVGAPGRSNKAGVVYVYEGQRGQKKLNSSPKLINQGPGLGSPFETGDRFGAQLSAADMNGDNIDDLVISAPGEDNEQGVAHLLFGSRNNGIQTSGSRLLRQGTAGANGVGGTADDGDRFGTSLAIGNFDGAERFNGTSILQIASSAPGETFGQFTDNGTQSTTGAVSVISAGTLGTAGVNGMSLVRSQKKTRTLQGGDADGILVGNNRNNRLLTGDGGDIALGKGGNDLLNGQSGDDLLDGGKGKDRYIGGEGHDTFVISRKNGKAIIRDFENKIDQIGLAHGLDFEDLTLKKRGRHTEIRLDDQSLALVRGTRPAQLKANDFVEVEYNRLQGMLVPSVVV